MQLVVQAGAQSGQVFEIIKDSLTIGRGSGNDIAFTDPAMSRVHCEIRREGDGYVVEDKHSANGTFVNNEQIELPFQLRPGDTIRMGQTVLLFQEECAQESSVAPAAQEAGSRPWGLIGGIAVIAVIIIAIAIATSNRSQGTNIAVAPTQTVAPVARATFTPLPTETATALPSATVTLVVATATPTAAAATVPSTGSVTKNYPVPILSVVQPAPQARYTASAAIPFSWIAVEPLTSSEQYRVQVASMPEFTQIACEIKTREAYASIPGEGVTCTNQWQFGQHYYWRVHVIPRDAFYSDAVAATDAAPVNEFNWGP